MYGDENIGIVFIGDVGPVDCEVRAVRTPEDTHAFDRRSGRTGIHVVAVPHLEIATRDQGLFTELHRNLGSLCGTRIGSSRFDAHRRLADLVLALLLQRDELGSIGELDPRCTSLREEIAARLA